MSIVFLRTLDILSLNLKSINRYLHKKGTYLDLKETIREIDHIQLSTYLLRCCLKKFCLKLLIFQNPDC